jgi:hypothetical protein
MGWRITDAAKMVPERQIDFLTNKELCLKTT